MSLIALLLNVGAIAVAGVLLWKAADWLVAAAARIALYFGISELVIGLTVVSIGTSAPEFAVTVGAALMGKADISLANVVGSNVFNLGFILGGVALMTDIKTTKPMYYRDGRFLLFCAFTLFVFCYNLTLGRFEGLVLMTLLVGYIAFLLIKRPPIDLSEEVDDADSPMIALDFVVLLLSTLGVVLGGQLLIYGATNLAEAAGVSDWIIGMTIVAGGTSLPEMVTSFAAARKGKFGISAGNLLGSDLFNMLGVLGVASFITPLAIAPGSRLSLLFMLGGIGIVLVAIRRDWRITRAEGGIIIAYSLFRLLFDAFAG